MRRPSTSMLFIYCLALTFLALAYRGLYSLALIAVPNAVLGLYVGYRRAKIIVVLLLLSLWGTLLNAVLVANNGPPVLVLGPVTLRQGALAATARIWLRLLAIASTALIFIGSAEPEEIIRDLEAELHLPKTITFSLAYALRLIPLLRRDYAEIMFCRRQRGYRRIAYLPGDIKTLLLPLLSIAYQRAVWAGITVELRGFRKRRPRHRPPRIGLAEAALLAWLLAQVIVPLALGWTS